jgi:rubrerythrin
MKTPTVEEANAKNEPLSVAVLRARINKQLWSGEQHFVDEIIRITRAEERAKMLAELKSKEQRGWWCSGCNHFYLGDEHPSDCDCMFDAVWEKGIAFKNKDIIQTIAKEHP